MIVSDLFLEQSIPWEAIARSHVHKAWKAAKEFLGHAAAYVADATTSRALFQKIFEPALNRLLEILNEKTTELLTPHQRSHPITHNHYFTETLQNEPVGYVRSNTGDPPSALDSYAQTNLNTIITLTMVIQSADRDFAYVLQPVRS